MASDPPTLRIQMAALEGVVDIAKALEVEHVCLKFHADGLKVVAFDIAHICLVSATIPLLSPPAAPFEEFFPTKDLGLAAKGLSDLAELDVVWKKESAELTFKSGRRRRTIKSITPPEGVKPKLPNLEYASRIVVSTAWLKRCVKGSAGIDSIRVLFSAAGGSLVWKVESGMGSYEDDIEAAVGEDREMGLYAHDYFAKLLGIASSTDIVVSMAMEYPCRMEFSLPAGTATAILAPVILP